MNRRTTQPDSAAPHAVARRAGFTLLELVVVMLILTITAAMVAPSLRGTQQSLTTKNAAANVVALCHYARTQAITEGRIYRLNIDVNARTFWLTATVEGSDARLLTDFGQVQSMPDGSTLTFTSAAATPNTPAAPNAAAAGQRNVSVIRFYPNGSQDIATLTVTDRSGTSVTVQCDSPTEPFHIVTAAELARR